MGLGGATWPKLKLNVMRNLAITEKRFNAYGFVIIIHGKLIFVTMTEVHTHSKE